MRGHNRRGFGSSGQTNQENSMKNSMKTKMAFLVALLMARDIYARRTVCRNRTRRRR